MDDPSSILIGVFKFYEQDTTLMRPEPKLKSLRHANSKRYN